jgi:serine/threonine protein kinase
VRSPAAIPAAEYEVEIVKYLKNQGVPHLLEVVYSGHYMKQKRGKEGDAFHAFSTRCDTDLAKELVQHGLQPREKFQVMDQLIEALAAAERAGVAHRDIKPANIFLIRNRDRTLSVKVGDWGLACKLADKPRQELCSGSEKYVPRAYIKRKVPLLETRKLDVFSLAKVFEHILHYPRVQRWPGAPQNAAMIQLIRRMLDPVAATRPSMTEVEAAWAEIKRQILAEHPGEPPAF